MPGAASLSVVVAAWTGPAALRACLASLRPQAEGGGLEIVVARNFAGAEDALAELPGAVDLALPETATVPALRAAGLARSSGPVVAFLEDHCTCAPGWAEALRRAHAAPHAGVGGPVELGLPASALAWAAYFYDYARYMPPCVPGPVEQLSGLNMSFKRPALASAGAGTERGVYEAELQAALRRTGATLYLEPGAVVVHRAPRRAAEAVRQAFHLARGYAARRVAGAAAVTRVTFGIGSLVLPLVLAARIVAVVRQKRRRRIALLAAFPWLLVLLGAWAAGEGAGYLLGAGGSEQQWR